MFFLAAALAASSGSVAENAADLCNKLAAEPGTVEGVAGIELEAIDAEAAIAACAAALEEAPGNPRLAHQYARALERAGRLEEAQRLYEWAAADGYAPATAALKRLAGAAGSSEDVLALPADAAQKAQMLAGVAAVLGRYEASLPPDPADPLPVLALVGSDPRALTDWVAANTRLVAYRGELRGAAGVLIDRSGNSLDRALLLAELLRLGGHEVRLAHATLTPEQAGLLLPATLRTVEAPALPRLSVAEAAELFQAEPRLDPADVRLAVEATQQQQERARRLFGERFALLLPALSEAVAPLAAAADSAAQAEVLAALADHFWVQLRAGTAWRDLDPETAILGTLMPSETFEPGQLPAELRQSVTLRVVLELQDSTGRREERLLEWQGFPAEVIDRPLQLSHVPRTLSAVDLEWLIAQPDARERLLAILDEEQSWMPLLAIGEDVLIDRLFTRDGRIVLANATSFHEAGQGLAALFEEADSLLGGGESTAPPEPAVPTAEWLEIEVHVPGAAPMIERRTIFDLIGPAVREAGTAAAFTDAQLRERALRLLGETQILLLGAAPSELQVTHIEVRELKAAAQRLSSVLAGGTLDLDALAPPAPMAPLALLHFASQRLAAPVGFPRAASGPTVVLQHRRLTLHAEFTVEAQLEIDIVRNEVSAARTPFDSRLSQGVADTVLEGLALERDAQVRNAAQRHAADLAAGRSWTRVEPPDLSRFAAHADYRARLEADLAAGYVVVAPAQPDATPADELAWWRIDPRNGTTLGMAASGGGDALVEYVQLMDKILIPGGCALMLMGSSIAGSGSPFRLTGLAACAIFAGGAGIATGLAGFSFAGGMGVAGIAAYLLDIGNVP